MNTRENVEMGLDSHFSDRDEVEEVNEWIVFGEDHMMVFNHVKIMYKDAMADESDLKPSFLQWVDHAYKTGRPTEYAG